MSNKKYNITKAIYDHLPENHPFQNTDLEKLIFTWWYTRRNGDSLRLTDEGKLAFDLANIEAFEFPMDTDADTFGRLCIELGYKVQSPFYVGFKNRQYKSAYIRVYDSKVAMMITLYGNLQDYLNRNKR